MAADLPPVVVTDGDTFRLGPERIRIANIDAPEMPGGAKCDAEANLAVLAKARLAGLLKGPAGAIEITRTGRDRYGRTLALIRATGGDIGMILVSEGLAKPWAGRRHRWCERTS